MTQRLLHKTLLHVRDAATNDGLITGICTAVTWAAYDREVWHDLQPLMLAWPKASGDANYPVPLRTENPEHTYRQAYIQRKLWDQTTEYGRNRMELLNWLIEQTAPQQ